MTDPRTISIQDYSYILPDSKIAAYPLAERDASRLLICRDGAISTDSYKNISQYIPAGSLLVFNNTKVVEARLLFHKPTGGVIEIFCLEPHEQYPDITTAMLQKGKVWWQCLVGGASKWKTGQVLEKKIPANNEILLNVKYIEKRSGCFIIELSWEPSSLSFAELLHEVGAIPLPPYIKRAAEGLDAERYQTVYARFDGSVAAPTAGLHFTPAIFNALEKKNIHIDYITLHVGAGTFKPVKSETLVEHEMHAEFIDVPKTTLENILSNIEKNIIAVGTTSLRTIESLYWLGVKERAGGGEWEVGRPGELSQWEAYELANQNVPVKDALEALLKWMERNKLEKIVAKTQLLIAPGYRFRIVKGLITNFHQPNSTLLLLVAALIGEDWRKVYDHALKNNFRFLSYGDGCLLWKADPSYHLPNLTGFS
ncbi:MAG: S-adenosylmethionine:tRNA ribosyltransferase-isomerase [Chitinophagaceae bacterium]